MHRDQTKAYVGIRSVKSSLNGTSISWSNTQIPGGFRRQPEEQRGMQLARGMDAGTKTVIGPRLAAERRTQMSHRRRGARRDGVGRGRRETVRLLGAGGSRAFYSHTFS